MLFVLSIAILFFGFRKSHADETKPFLKHRGPGVATSMFGVYIEKGQFMLYPFYEYYSDNESEYNPSELGYNVDEDYEGKHLGHEGPIFWGYGISDMLAFEMEIAVITEEITKADDDTSDMPDTFEESGLGDVEGQFRWRYNKETTSKPEFIGFFEFVFPFQKEKKLIGTQAWEFKLGQGITKGYSWGNMTIRAAIEYDGEDDEIVLGEFAIEWFNKLTPKYELYIGIEGNEDEIEFIPDLHINITDRIMIKLNGAFGLTEAAEDFAPEVGILFSL